MRATVTCLVAATTLAGCLRGDDDRPPPPFLDEGGTLEVPGCGYSVTTRLGASAPELAAQAHGPRRGPAPTPMQVHLGFVGDPRTSMVVQWRTVDEVSTSSEVRFGAGADLPPAQLTELVDGLVFRYRATGTNTYQMHQAHLCGLTPGTSYSYQVGPPDAASPVYTFRTAPDVAANPDAEVVLGVLGDSRGGYDVWAQMTELLRARAPDLLLFSGDAVTIGLVQDEWEAFFTRGERLLASVPLVAAHGNHEVNAVNYYAQIAMPGDQETFGFDWGHAHVTIANDTPEDVTALTGAFRDAIAADLTASESARWKLLVHHQPMWSASNHGSSLALQEAWGPLVDQHHLDLVLNGHEHEYEVTHPLAGGVVQASNTDGTVYVVAGGAGAELYASGTDYWTAYSESTHAAALVRIRRDSLVLEAFRADGSLIPVGVSKTKP